MSPGGSSSVNLSDLVVQFVLKGKDELKAGVAQIQQGVAGFASAVGEMASKMVAGMVNVAGKLMDAAGKAKDLGAAFEKAGTAINVALGAGTAAIIGFARQGLAASGMGQVLSFQMERLALTIGGLFRPEIEKLLSGIQRLTDWINSLSDSQKKAIAYWVEAGAAALAVGAILPRIVAGIGAVIGAVRALGAAIAGAEAATGIGAILPILGLVAEAFTVLMVSSDEGRTALGEIFGAFKELAAAAKELWDVLEMDSIWQGLVTGLTTVVHWVAQLVKWVADLIKKFNELTGGTAGKVLGWMAAALVGPLGLIGKAIHELNGETEKKEKPGSRSMLPPRTGGFEDLGAAYKRIAVASLRATSGVKSPEERTAAGIEEANKHLSRIEGHTAREKVVMGR